MQDITNPEIREVPLPTISPDLSGQLAAELAAPTPFPDDLDGDAEFRAWMLRVNRAVTFAIGLSTDDLPDYLYRDDYDAGYPATETARRAIRASW